MFLTQPLQIGTGSVAGSKWMSDDLYKRAASTKKNFHVVEGSNHRGPNTGSVRAFSSISSSGR